jgi:hypothetical protein
MRFGALSGRQDQLPQQPSSFHYSEAIFRAEQNFYRRNLWSEFAVESRYGAYSQFELPSLKILRKFEVLNLSQSKQSGHNEIDAYRIDRLSLSGSYKNYTWKLGRQPVSLGTSHFIGLLDIINPFATASIDHSYKPGIDALRVSKSIGYTGEQEYILGFNEESEHNAYLFRHRNLYGRFDVEFITGRARRRNLIGAGWEGDIETRLSTWGEILFLDRTTDPYREGMSNTLASMITGMDYHIEDGTTAGLSFYHNDQGASNVWEQQQIISDSAIQEGWLSFTGRQYGIFTFTSRLKPLVQFQMNIVQNLDDRSRLFQPQIIVNRSNNATLTLYLNFTQGGVTTDMGQKPDALGMLYTHYF